MKQKTAMMVLIEWIELRFNNPYQTEVYAKAKQLLEKEKEQIINAYIDGEQAQGYEDEANLYYNQTYLEESKQ